MGEQAQQNRTTAKPNHYAGPYYSSDGWLQFKLHAPRAESVSLTFSNDGLNWLTHEMSAVEDGNFFFEDKNITPGARYWYVVNGADGYPDPWSRYQPDGPHAASQIVSDNRFIWHDQNWMGRQWCEAAIYELHVGTFTPQGTFLAAISRLKLLQEMGITIVQIMPIWTVPGGPSWGYDANYLFSVNADFGEPDDFKRFIDAAHALGIQVILDVIYNHLGIEGNYLSKFDECWLLPDEGNQWGAKLNYDRPGCGIARSMIIANALFWLREYHLDGLRIDAPVAIEDKSGTHILIEMAKAIRNHYNDGRQIHLILENDHYAGRIKTDHDDLLFDASINIEGGECLVDMFQGKSTRFETEKTVNLMDCMKGEIGFEFNADYPAGKNTTKVIHSDRQIIGIQNHDLIGNSQDPQRIWPNLNDNERKLSLAFMCLTPSLPSFFMGDEIGCEQVFPFFCKFNDVSELEVLNGRTRDFEFTKITPDYWSPYSRHTFEAAVIQWPDDAGLKNNNNYQMISLLLELRRKSIIPLAQDSKVISSTYRSEDGFHQITWNYRSGKRLIFEFYQKPKPIIESIKNLILKLDDENWLAEWRVE